MTKEYNEILCKTMKTIQNKLEYLNNSIDLNDFEIVELDKSLVIQYLDDWNNFNNNFFFKNFKVDGSFFEKVTIFYVPKGKELYTKFQENYNTVFCLDGKLLLKSENNVQFNCDSLTAMTIKEKNFTIEALGDSYLLLIK